MSAFRRLLSLIGLAWTGLALASPASAGNVPVRLVAPQSGAALLGGSTAELEWAPLAPFSRLEDVEEWEAFLSFDGGETYPVRITPHLDRDLRRVRWQVPAIPASEARLLLRFGDEHRELYLELPQRFSITGAPGPEPLFALANLAASPGEPALPGSPGVVAWVEGSRRGGGLRRMVAPERLGLQGTVGPPERQPQVAVLGPQEASPAPAPQGGGGPSPAARRAAAPQPPREPRRAVDILLLTRRQNE
jgi:hypothetical protein